jgi:hypothetical protein
VGLDSWPALGVRSQILLFEVEEICESLSLWDLPFLHRIWISGPPVFGFGLLSFFSSAFRRSLLLCSTSSVRPSVSRGVISFAVGLGLQHSREIKLRQAVHSRRQGISLASSESWSCQNLFSKVLIQIHQLYSECNLLFIPGVRQSLGSDKGSRWHHDRAGEAKLFSKVLIQIFQPYLECNLLFIRGDKGSGWHLQTAGAAKTYFRKS